MKKGKDLFIWRVRGSLDSQMPAENKVKRIESALKAYDENPKERIYNI